MSYQRLSGLCEKNCAGNASRCIINIIVVLLFLYVYLAPVAYSQGFSPEQPAATPFATYTNRYFVINGKPTWIFAGEIDYCRVPKELWRDRLMRMKRAGYNTAAFYTFWNMHEPIRGEFHYEDNLDLDAWLTLIHELGLYAIVRPGPYICAETDFGGFPSWFVDVSGIRYRCSNAQYLACVDAYWENIFPVILKHQIHKGGPVIFMQLENEYWVPIPDNTYKEHLIDKALDLGMEVPYIWSMTFNASNPDPGLFPNLSYPWFSTEQWTGWIGRYGEPSANDARDIIRTTWRIVAGGTGGTTHYMFHGGTNFGYTASDDQRNTSYDYGAPLGELGQFRSTYKATKRTGLLVQSFNDNVTLSTNGSSAIGTLPGGLDSYVHASNKGMIAFVHNTGNSSQSFKVTWLDKNISVPTDFNWSLDALGFAHFFCDVPVTDNTTIDYSATGILTLKHYGSKHYCVLYGDGSGQGEIAFTYSTVPASTPQAPWQWNAADRKATLSFFYPSTDSISEVVLPDINNESIHCLIMNTDMADRTWVTDTYLVCGAEYLDHDENLHFTQTGGTAAIYSAAGKQAVEKEATTAPGPIDLSSGWRWSSAGTEAGTGYDDSSWEESDSPQDMTWYGWPNGYGWYRTTYTASSAGSATLRIANKQDDVFIFVNGEYSGTRINLTQGANTIAIMVVDYCRSKAFGAYNVSPRDIDRSGIWGAVTIDGNATGPWRFRGGFDGVEEAPMMGNISPDSWSSLCSRQWNSSSAPNDNIPRFWRIDFDYTPPENGNQTWTLQGDVTTGSQGIVWINGHCLGRQITNQPPLFVPECWLAPKNTLVILTQNGAAPQNYSLQPEEYRSFVRPQIIEISKHGPVSVESKQAGILQLLTTFSDNHIDIPEHYVHVPVTLSVYNLKGSLMRTINTIGNARVTITNDNLAKNMYIVTISRQRNN